MTSKRMLIVDDEDAILYAYKRLFGSPRNGIAVDTARDVVEAIACLQKNKYRVVITDLRLGIEDDMGGFKIIEAIKGFDQDIKIILVTAYGNPQVKKESFEKGADFYLEKPVPLDILKGILKNLDMIPHHV